jgi:hypothetical protein
MNDMLLIQVLLLLPLVFFGAAGLCLLAVVIRRIIGE